MAYGRKTPGEHHLGRHLNLRAQLNPEYIDWLIMEHLWDLSSQNVQELQKSPHADKKLGYHTIMRREFVVPAQNKTPNAIAPSLSKSSRSSSLSVNLKLAVSTAANHASSPESDETPPTDLPSSPETLQSLTFSVDRLGYLGFALLRSGLPFCRSG